MESVDVIDRLFEISAQMKKETSESIRRGLWEEAVRLAELHNVHPQQLSEIVDTHQVYNRKMNEKCSSWEERKDKLLKFEGTLLQE